MRDTIESLRPQLEFFRTPQEAYEAAMELEKKFRDKMGEIMRRTPMARRGRGMGGRCHTPLLKMMYVAYSYG